MINWEQEAPYIAKRIANGETTTAIGYSYGVSRQRIYQVLTKYGISTVAKRRKNYLRDKAPKYYWLNKMLVLKGFSKTERLQLLDMIALPDVCPALGIPINYGVVGVMSDNSPSIDRLDNTQGYTPENIHVISLRANRLKSDATPAELLQISEYIKACAFKKTMV